MKAINLFLTAALASVALSATSAFAGTDSARASACGTKPTVTKMVSPTELPRGYENVTVKVALTIDEHGVPHDVRPIGWMEQDLSSRLLPAIQQWRFTPSLAQGKPVATQVVLPVKLVEGA